LFCKGWGNNSTARLGEIEPSTSRSSCKRCAGLNKHWQPHRVFGHCLAFCRFWMGAGLGSESFERGIHQINLHEQAWLGNKAEMSAATQPSSSEEVMHNAHGIPCLGMTAAHPPSHAPLRPLFPPFFLRMILLQPNAMSTWARVAAQQVWMTTFMTQPMTMSSTLCDWAPWMTSSH